MDLNAILDGIQKAGQQQIAKIEQEAEKQASQILVKVRKDADLQKNRILADGKAHMNRQQAMIEQQAVIQSLQIHADARQKLIESVIKKTVDQFPDLRKNKDYEKTLTGLVDEAIQCVTPSLIKGQKVIMHFDPRDKKMAERILENYDQAIIAQYDIECSGGCNAETEDGLVLTLNTIESRFEHASTYIKQSLSIFFERKYSSG